ncbi:MAG: Alpha amylase [Blastococcus sp.]|nr:Alpha amylase [Blastococcus sp.]
MDDSPEWVADVIWWHVYPLGFLGAEREAIPDGAVPSRLGRLEPWLDYAVELGASGIALGPVFASETHGYDTVDHLRIDPRLGTDADFDALVVAAHARGLRVLLDGVFNHVGRSHPAFRAVLEQGPSAPTASWFRLTWPRPWERGVEPEAADFEGHGSLVALNHDEPAVADHVVEVMTHWLARGADGWRLDAASAVPTSFWAGVLPRVRTAHPQAYLVGEVLHGDYAAFVRGSGLDAVTQYELWKAVWSSLNDGNFFELAHALQRHTELLDTFVPLTFLGNHDVTRLASRLTDERYLAHALVVLLTSAGTPTIYSGDEQAFRGVKEDRAGGDDAVRPAFPDRPEELSTLGEPVHRLHQELIGLRRRHRWLHGARTAVLHLTNEQFAYEVVADEGRLVVALNVGEQPADLPAAGAGEVLAGSATVRLPSSPSTRVRLPGAGWAVLAG